MILASSARLDGLGLDGRQLEPKHERQSGKLVAPRSDPLAFDEAEARAVDAGLFGKLDLAHPGSRSQDADRAASNGHGALLFIGAVLPDGLLLLLT